MPCRSVHTSCWLPPPTGSLPLGKDTPASHPLCHLVGLNEDSLCPLAGLKEDSLLELLEGRGFALAEVPQRQLGEEYREAGCYQVVRACRID